jgi:putative salt-induced outer membrane protein YdiY
VSIGGGMSLTGGNTDTSSYNLTANIVHDPKRKNVFRAELLYLRASEDDEATLARSAANLRDEYAVSGQAYVYGQLAYQRDRFKEVDYLIAPTIGGGYKFVDNEKVLFALDAGFGAAFERLTGLDGTTDLALTATERLQVKPIPTTTIFQKTSALWKADDFGDAYYRFEVGLTTAIMKRLELKVAFVDDYKTRPPDPSLKKNDTSFILSVLFKL